VTLWTRTERVVGRVVDFCWPNQKQKCSPVGSLVCCQSLLLQGSLVDEDGSFFLIRSVVDVLNGLARNGR
jgi:hypothetical protein